MSDDTLEDINPSVARRGSLGIDSECTPSGQTLDEINFSDDLNFDPLLDDPGPIGRALRALDARIEKLENENEALKSIVSRLEPVVWQMLTDDGFWRDATDEHRERAMAAAFEGIKYRRERNGTLLMYGDTLKSIADKAEQGHDPAKSTEIKIAVIFDNLHKNGNRPMYIPALPLGDGPHKSLSKMQKEGLSDHLKRDGRFEVGKAPQEAFYYGRLPKNCRKGRFVWLREKKPQWDRPLIRFV